MAPFISAISLVTDSLSLAFLENTLLRNILDFLESSDRSFRIFPLEMQTCVKEIDFNEE